MNFASGSPCSARGPASPTRSFPASILCGFPLGRWANVFTVEATLNESVDARLVLDTGASFTTVNLDVAKSLGIANDEPLRIVAAVTANGEVELPVYRIESIDVGGATVTNVEIGVCSACGADHLDGLLGLNFAADFVVTLDAQTRTLLLDPRRDGIEPSRRSIGGPSELLGTVRD